MNLTIIIAIVVALVSLIIFAYFFERRGLRDTDWGRIGLFFGIMIVGMIARELYNILANGREFNWVGFVLALIVSPIVFNGVYYQIAEVELNPPSVILAFQNGFFWNTIFEAAGPSTP